MILQTLCKKLSQKEWPPKVSVRLTDALSSFILATITLRNKFQKIALLFTARAIFLDL